MADIRRCTAGEAQTICAIVNDAAEAYRGVVAPDCWNEPYMPIDELEAEIRDGVEFWGYERAGELLGVMGLQQVHDAWLIRHAYVRTDHQHEGIGGALLERLREHARSPLLVGTWAAAEWAIEFYEARGFERAGPAEKDALLRRYWKVSERQREESVVLVHRSADPS